MESFSHLLSIVHVNTVCERLLAEFMFVADTFLLTELCAKIQAYAFNYIRFTVVIAYLQEKTREQCIYLRQKCHDVTNTGNFTFGQIFNIGSNVRIFSELHMH
jgi:predicted membrane protein